MPAPADPRLPPPAPVTPPAPADWRTPAGVAETHISVVVFVGDRAYKLLKPVDVGFLDYSTLEARRRACQREVELNRRFAPDVYLGVLDVVDERGRTCDHLIAMRRMPAERRLSQLLDAPEAADHVRAVARLVAAVHQRSPTSPAVQAAATPEAVRGNWEDNFAQLRRFAGPVLDAGEVERVASLVREYLDGRAPLLLRRIRDGWVRDGHGDLLADDVFMLDDGPRVIDCLAFDDRLRHGDVVADVAFLAMDLERLGHPGLGAALVRWYEEFSGERHPASLAHHYIAYRAHVRAKVACLRVGQGDAAAAAAARDAHRLALRHLARGRVRLVLVGGAPGAGKTTLAERLSQETGWMLLRSDEIRKDLAGIGHLEPAAAPPDRGIYAPEMTERVYAELIGRARRLLELGESVVLDASWTAAAHRARAREAAAAACAPAYELRCDVPAQVAAARVSRRRGDASDARAQIARLLYERAGEWGVRVDTSGSLERAVADAIAAVREPEE